MILDKIYNLHCEKHFQVCFFSTFISLPSCSPSSLRDITSDKKKSTSLYIFSRQTCPQYWLAAEILYLLSSHPIWFQELPAMLSGQGHPRTTTFPSPSIGSSMLSPELWVSLHATLQPLPPPPPSPAWGFIHSFLPSYSFSFRPPSIFSDSLGLKQKWHHQLKKPEARSVVCPVFLQRLKQQRLLAARALQLEKKLLEEYKTSEENLEGSGWWGVSWHMLLSVSRKAF